MDEDGWGCDMLELVNRDRVRSIWCFDAILTDGGRRGAMCRSGWN
jgi:hypothetical protein